MLGGHISELQSTYTENRARDIGAILMESGDYKAAREKLDKLKNHKHLLRPRHPATTINVQTRASILGDHIYKGYVSMLNGPGGAGKSVFSLTMAISLAIGRDLLGLGDLKQRRALVLNNEDPQDEIERRLKAIMVAYRLDEKERDQVAENMWFQSGYHERIKLAAEDSELRLVIPTPLQCDLITFCQDNNIDALFLDPLVSIHDCGENDNNAMNAVVQILREVAEEGRVGIYIAHHSRKGGSADTPDDNARGASAITAGVRANYGLSRMTEKESAKFVLEDDQWAHMIRLDSGKRNYSPNAANAIWFELKNTPLDATDWETGESATEWVGVPVPAKLELVENTAEAWNLERVLKRIMMVQVKSPFTLSGQTLEDLQSALSDTNKPIKRTSMHKRMKYFPAKGESPRSVLISDTVYRCWSELGSHNTTVYHFEGKSP